MPQVSIIIPAYNRNDFLTQAVQSVLSQTVTELEVLVVDDGSTDDSRRVIENIHDERLRYFYKQNGGVSSARNFGLARATGEYVCFLDSDDFWSSSYLEIMLQKMVENPDYEAAYCMRTLLFPDGREVPSYQKEYCMSGRLTENLFKKSFIQTSTLCFKRTVLQGLFFDESLSNAEDADMWLKVSMRTKFLFVPDIQITYREGFGNSSHQEFSSKQCNRIRVLERFYFRLGGDKYIPKKTATNKLGRAYRSVAKKSCQDRYRRASIYLYKKAISYCRWDARLYLGLLKAFLISPSDDKQPGWTMPGPLETV